VVNITGDQAIVQAFIESMARWERDFDAGQMEWIAGLRSQGVQAAHPDDGWVDRAANTIFLAYPYFRDSIAIGSPIALGDYRKFRLVKVAAISHGLLGQERIAFRAVGE